MRMRTEKDLIGTKQIPANALWGIHTARSIENFPISGSPVHSELIKAFGEVKLACVQINNQLGFWKDTTKAEAMEKACFEMAQGLLNVEAKMPEARLIGTVHDEALALILDRLIKENTLDRFNSLLCDIPWANTCPLRAEGYIAKRYKKD